ncbi:MAG: hypothetical protein EB076_09340, partial [Flavobacteriia bacterium]|nr:hypothetical protein [Flavobacteriia bacterium]
TLAVYCKSMDQAVELANYIAPEHLELQVSDALIDSLTKNIRSAGAILQGYDTPTVLGDFTAGPSHTLPTGRAGRFFSGLQAIDFMRRTSTVRYNAKSIQKAAPVVERVINTYMKKYLPEDQEKFAAKEKKQYLNFINQRENAKKKLEDEKKEQENEDETSTEDEN